MHQKECSWASIQNTCRKMWLVSFRTRLPALAVGVGWFLCRVWIQLKRDFSTTDKETVSSHWAAGSLFGSGSQFFALSKNSRSVWFQTVSTWWWLLDVLILTRPARRGVCLCVCVSTKHGCRSMLLKQTCPGLCRAPIMSDIVVMDVHQHGNGLANDERDPHCGVAIVSIQETAHNPSQRNLKGWRFRGLSLVDGEQWLKGGSCVLPEPSFP